MFLTQTIESFDISVLKKFLWTPPLLSELVVRCGQWLGLVVNVTSDIVTKLRNCLICQVTDVKQDTFHIGYKCYWPYSPCPGLRISRSCHTWTWRRRGGGCPGPPMPASLQWPGRGRGRGRLLALHTGVWPPGTSRPAGEIQATSWDELDVKI